MLFSLRKSILLLVLFLCACFFIPPAWLCITMALFVFVNIQKKHEKKEKAIQKNMYNDDLSLKKTETFLSLIPVLSVVQKKIVFYKVEDVSFHHFFDTFRYLVQSKEMTILGIQFMIPLPFVLLADNHHFANCIVAVDRIKKNIGTFIFDVSFDQCQKFTDKFVQLGKMGVRFNVHTIPLKNLDTLLKGFLSPYIHSYQINHEQLFHLMKNDLMLTTVDGFSDHKSHLLVSDIQTKEDMDHLPTLVDYVCGPAFDKPISFPLPQSA